MRRARTIFLVATAALGFAHHAKAQRAGDPPCVLDKCLNGGAASAPAPTQPMGQGGAAQRPLGTKIAPGAFDFYVLALSWSPGFCDTGGAAKAGKQCADGAKLGFVVHGLWPQNAQGYPSNCNANSRFVPRPVLEGTDGLYPDRGLAIHEWRQHGTCTGLSPSDYFDQVRQARAAITVPTALSSPSEPQSFAPMDIARAFVAANSGLQVRNMAVTCRQSELEEVRICMTKDLRGFTECPEISRASCRTRSITVLPVR